MLNRHQTQSPNPVAAPLILDPLVVTAHVVIRSYAKNKSDKISYRRTKCIGCIFISSLFLNILKPALFAYIAVCFFCLVHPCYSTTLICISDADLWMFQPQIFFICVLCSINYWSFSVMRFYNL